MAHKKTKVRRHTRKTRKGKVPVRKHIRKIPKIRTRERRIFNYLSRPRVKQVEYGGEIDFGKDGTIERFSVHPGDLYAVDIPTDFELVYHTHPDRLESPPTIQDLFALIESEKQQASLIFRDGKVFIISKTPKTKKLEKLPRNKLTERLLNDFESKVDFPRKGNERRAVKALKELGFNVRLIEKSEKPFEINIKPKEPKKKQFKLLREYKR